MDHLGNIGKTNTKPTLLDISNRKSYNNPYLEERPNGLRLPISRCRAFPLARSQGVFADQCGQGVETAVRFRGHSSSRNRRSADI